VVEWPSGQWQQTVNLPSYEFEGSNPSSTTIFKPPGLAPGFFLKKADGFCRTHVGLSERRIAMFFPSAAPNPEYVHAREETWGGFTHLVKWFIVHMALILAGLYDILMSDRAVSGAILLALAGFVLVYGAVTTPRAGRHSEMKE
jgi:hypothetical protein